MSDVSLWCQHCSVEMGEWPENIHQFPQYCPYFGERVMPEGGGE